MENNNFKENDICYYIEDLDTPVQKAKILQIISKDIIKLKNLSSGPWTLGSSLDRIFHTKEEAETAMKAKEEKIKDEYRNSIQNVKDLVEFCFGNNTAPCEEYTDWQAREVAIEKAKELLGIDLEK